MFFCRAAILLPLTLAASAQSAKIQGIVTDDMGRPVSGILAVATLQSPADHSTYTAITNSKGEYSFANLSSGKYSICVQSPGGPHLSNCHWATPVQVTVASGQTIANQNIAVSRGAVLQVRVDDHKNFAAKDDDLLVAVYLPSGAFLPLRLAISNTDSRTYEAAVPRNTPLRLTVVSGHLKIADDKGKDLGPHGNGNSAAAAATLTITEPPFIDAPPVVLTVTGRQ
jgi:hypothetical protein